MFPEDAFLALPENAVPEIQRCNLSSMILQVCRGWFNGVQLKTMGIEDILGFHYLQAPSRDSLKRSLEQLLASLGSFGSTLCNGEVWFGWRDR